MTISCCVNQASRPFRRHLVVLLQVASGSAAVPATAHRRFHVEKKQRRGLPVILPETIVRRRCAALIPYARNARTHSDQQVAQIAASIREFGFTNPVLIDEYRWPDSADGPSQSASGA